MRLAKISLLLLLAQGPGARAGIVDDIIDAIKDAVTCAGCHTLLVPLKALATLGDSPFVATFTAVCKVLNVVDEDVCVGAVKTQTPVIAHGLRAINPLGHTARKLCNGLLGLCQPPAVNQWKVPFPKAAPADPKTFVSTGKKPFQVVHFSDIHVDRSYTPGAEANCTKPICCRPYADHVGTISVPAGAMGDHKCDTPTPLAQSLLRSISANHKFAIFTGDVIEASVWLADQKDVTRDMKLFDNELATIPGAPVFPTLGNHESAPTNLFPRNTTKKANVQWIFDTQSEGWAPIINATAAEQVAHFSGSYSTVAPGTNLRIIAINTVYWYKFNFWLYDSDRLQPDPNGILAFAIQELQAAEDAGQRVWIVAHMPPGRKDTLHDQSNYWDQVVQRYRNTIAGQFFGHTHQDEFVIAYSDYKKQTAENAVSVGWIAPAVTPRGGNPGFRLYDVDPDTYEIMDSSVYRSDLADPNYQIQPTWDLYYSAREVYGPYIGGWPATSALTPAFWHKVTEAFEKDDRSFQIYNEFRTRGVSQIICDGECKEDKICDIRAMRSEDGCSEYTLGLNFRRDVDGHGEHAHLGDECEGLSMGHIFSQLSNLTPDELETLRIQLKEIIPDA